LLIPQRWPRQPNDKLKLESLVLAFARRLLTFDVNPDRSIPKCEGDQNFVSPKPLPRPNFVRTPFFAFSFTRESHPIRRCLSTKRGGCAFHFMCFEKPTGNPVFESIAPVLTRASPMLAERLTRLSHWKTTALRQPHLWRDFGGGALSARRGSQACPDESSGSSDIARSPMLVSQQNRYSFKGDGQSR